MIETPLKQWFPNIQTRDGASGPRELYTKIDYEKFNGDSRDIAAYFYGVSLVSGDYGYRAVLNTLEEEIVFIKREDNANL